MILAAAPALPPDFVADTARITALAWIVGGGALLFFLLRPELWRRLFLVRIDPRPAALMRLTFGAVLLWAWCGLIPLGRELFTDEGIWLTEQARAGERMLAYVWDPVEGFEGPAGVWRAITGPFTVLHLRSDPTFVGAIWVVMLAALFLMTIGLWTRLATFVAWLSMHQLYGYSTLFFSSADNAIRVFLFLALFLRWGEAYSIDSWRRRRRAIASGALEFPEVRFIPAWPQRLMMLQLALIYFTTGLLKSGLAWKNGTALYYALNLDHFYRVPLMGVVALLQQSGVLVLSTWVVRMWEFAFPLVLVGLVVRTWEQERASGLWPASVPWRRVASWFVAAVLWLVLSLIVGIAAYHHWSGSSNPFGVARASLRPLVTAVFAVLPVLAGLAYFSLRRTWPRFSERILPWLLGRRVWLGLGVMMHLGIWLAMNVGSFSQVMLTTYFPWLTGQDVDRLWSFACGRRMYRVRYEATEAGVRRAALLRVWDVGRRLVFEPRAAGEPALEVVVDGGDVLRDRRAANALMRVFPGLWWLGLVGRLPGLSGVAGGLALRILRQERAR